MKRLFNKQKEEKPLKKGICINCRSYMLKRKNGEYHCLKCGNKIKYKK